MPHSPLFSSPPPLPSLPTNHSPSTPLPTSSATAPAGNNRAASPPPPRVNPSIHPTSHTPPLLESALAPARRSSPPCRGSECGFGNTAHQTTLSPPSTPHHPPHPPHSIPSSLPDAPSGSPPPARSPPRAGSVRSAAPPPSPCPHAPHPPLPPTPHIHARAPHCLRHCLAPQHHLRTAVAQRGDRALLPHARRRPFSSLAHARLPQSHTAMPPPR